MQGVVHQLQQDLAFLQQDTWSISSALSFVCVYYLLRVFTYDW
jgi:hypothetical protein